MKLTSILFALVISLITTGVQAQLNNTLSDQEKKEGWKLLFDGKTMKGWRAFNKPKVGTAWTVQDGAIYLNNKQGNGAEPKSGGDIISSGMYENFSLSVEWKISPCGNSGIFFHVVENKKYKYIWETGPEVQVLDNFCHTSGDLTKHRAGDLYDLVASTSESAKPAGEWNTTKITLLNGHLQVWLNTVKQIDIIVYTPEWEALIKTSKFKDIAYFWKSRKGHIGLQDHGDSVWYRNIKIKELK